MGVGAVGDLDDDGEYEAPRRVDRVHEFYVVVRHKRLRHVFDRARLIVIPKDMPRPDDPVLKYFRASKTRVKAGETVELSWRAEKAEHVQIEPGVGRKGTRGSVRVRPMVTTQYTCIAVQQYWQDLARIRIEVEPGPLPPGPRVPRITEFSVTPDRVLLGTAVTIRWKTSRATSIRLLSEMGEQYLAASGSMQYTPTSRGAQELMLVVANPFGADQRRISLRVSGPVLPRPQILEFSADATRVRAGQPVTLTYRTRHARRVYLLTPDRRRMLAGSSGQTVVYPEQDSTYKLEARNLLGTAESSLSINVLAQRPPPVVLYFQAEPGRLLGPGEVRLRWRVIGARRVQIEGLPQMFSSRGEVTLTVAASRGFRLTARNRAGATEARTAVTVLPLPPPQIVSFEADPAVRLGPGPVRLSWRTIGATSVDVVGWRNPNVPAGDLTVYAARTQEFLLRASNATAVTEARCRVEVRAVRPPRILIFSIDPQRLFVGETAQLSWRVTNATQVQLVEPDGSVKALAAIGTQEAKFDRPGRYQFRLVAGSPVGQVEATAGVDVLTPPKPKIVRFQATPPAVLPGETVTLDWETAHAALVWIEGLTGALPMKGSRQFRITQPTTFKLLARGPAGEQSATVRVGIVPPRKPYIRQFTCSTGEVERGQPVTFSWNVRNATRITLGNLDVSKTAVGKRTLYPSASGEWMLEATNPFGKASAKIRITVREPLPADLSVADIRRGYGGRPTFSIHNAGPGAVDKDFVIEIWINGRKAETLTYSAKVFGALGPNAVFTLTANGCTIPQGLAVVTVKLDVTKKVREVKEDNNATSEFLP
jgi:hypothetical protein